MAWPLAARAQQPDRMRRIGMLMPFDENDSESKRRFFAFTQALADLSWTDGGNVLVDLRWGGGDINRIRALARELVGQQPDIIVTSGTPETVAVQRETATIPIVFGVNENPVNLGLVASIARPAGNATGINLLGQEILTKQLELLHKLVPKAVRVAVLVNPANAANTEATLRAVPDAARALRLEIQVLKASSIREIEAAFARLVRERADALFVGGDGFFGSRRLQFTILSVRHGIPVVGGDNGLLMTYGTDSAYMYREAGVYTGRILKGAKPADLPVIQSTKLELTINLTMAKALGIDVPSNVLALADEVIE